MGNMQQKLKLMKKSSEKYDMHCIVFIRKWNFLKFSVEKFHDIQYNMF